MHVHGTKYTSSFSSSIPTSTAPTVEPENAQAETVELDEAARHFNVSIHYNHSNPPRRTTPTVSVHVPAGADTDASRTSVNINLNDSPENTTQVRPTSSPTPVPAADPAATSNIFRTHPSSSETNGHVRQVGRDTHPLSWERDGIQCTNGLASDFLSG